jgi:hypothetical protein
MGWISNEVFTGGKIQKVYLAICNAPHDSDSLELITTSLQWMHFESNIGPYYWSTGSDTKYFHLPPEFPEDCREKWWNNKRITRMRRKIGYELIWNNVDKWNIHRSKPEINKSRFTKLLDKFQFSDFVAFHKIAIAFD